MTSKHYMTKTIVLGEHKDDAIKKPIEFKYFLTEDIEIGTPQGDNKSPSSFKFIELICKEYDQDHDLMFAYNDANERGSGILMIGRWNDGVVK